jgi:aspartate aminotransferase
MKAQVELRLVALYEGFSRLSAAGYPVRAISPEGAIYLTVSFDLRGRTTASGASLHTMGDVTQFLLEEAKLAIVPFTAFGAAPDSPWYRLSVGTVRPEEVGKILAHVENALKQLG